jgi:hypothetical protein
LHAAAFLVDEDGCVAAGCVTSGGDQASQLRGCFDVAREDDEAPRLALAQERTLDGRQGRARKTGDESAYRHWRGLGRA